MTRGSVTTRPRPPQAAARSGGTADEMLRAFVDSRQRAEKSVAGVREDIAVATALAVVVGSKVSLAVDAESGIVNFTPGNLMNLTFGSPRVGLTDAQMPEFLQNLAIMFDSATASRILDEIAPLAGQRIGHVSELLRLWQQQRGA